MAEYCRQIIYRGSRLCQCPNLQVTRHFPIWTIQKYIHQHVSFNIDVFVIVSFHHSQIFTRMPSLSGARDP